MIVVLDTNCFHGDRGVSRTQLTTLLGHAERGRCSVVVPEAVIAELVNQYPSALKSAIDKTRSALGGLSAVNVSAETFVPPDFASTIANYESLLRDRLSQPGCQISPHPDRLDAVVDRSIRELKPFGTKKADNSVVDTMIWLTVLDSVDEDDVVLVSSNTNDFCEEDTTEFHEHLKRDLNGRAHGARLITYVQDLIDELAPSEGEEGQALLEQPEVRSEIDRRLYDALIHESIDKDLHELVVDLDNDPTIDQLDVIWLEALSFAAVNGTCTVEFNAYCSAQLELFIYKPDFWGISEMEGFWPSDIDYNEHYVQAASELELRVRCLARIASDNEVADLEVIVVEPVLSANGFARSLTNHEQVELMNAIRQAVDEATVAVDGYLPPQAVESAVESAVIVSFNTEAFEVLSALYIAPDTWKVRVRARSDTSVQWLIPAPTPAEAETFATLDISDDDAAPILQDTEDFAPVDVYVEFTHAADGGWVDAVASSSLSEDAARDRSSRRRPRPT
ncbi:MAG: PIN domain-containing protein [Solirubrobacterales bacterium]